MILPILVLLFSSCVILDDQKNDFPEIDDLLLKIEEKIIEHKKTAQEWNEIQAMGEAAAPRLVKIIKEHSDPEMRRGAVSVLGQLQYKAGFEVIKLSALNDNSSTVRSWALSALEMIDHEQAYVIILDLTQDPDISVRRMVAKILRKYIQQNPCIAIKELMHDPDSVVRSEAYMSYFYLPCPNTKETIEKALIKEKHYPNRMTLELLLKKEKNAE